MYYTIYIYLLIVSFVEVFTKLKLKKILLINIFILILFTGFRYYNGSDYGTYLEIFKEVVNIKDLNYLEIGFRYTIVLLKLVFGSFSPEIFFLVFAIMGLLPLYFGIKNEKYSNLALFIYYCVFLIDYNFNGLRQSIVMGMYIWACSLILNKQYYKSVGVFVLSSLFHNSAFIIFSSTYLVLKKKNRFKLRYILGIFFIVILISKNSINYLKVFPKVANHLKHFSNELKLSSIIMRIIIIVIISYFINKYKEDLSLKKLFNIYIFGFFLYGLFYPIGLFSTRINMLFRVLEILIIPKIFLNLNNSKIKLGFFLVILIIITLPFYKNLQDYRNYPYRIWIIKN